jgi:hypothetical protein
MSTDYRSIARRALERARNELNTGNADRLPYAALELRYAMEALTYDRARTYQDEVPPEFYRTWEPRKVVDYITEIDDKAYLSSLLSVGLEDEPGKPAKVMQPLGTETALTMKDLKRHYQAMGSFLHMPTLHQIEQGSVPGKDRIRERCEKCATVLEGVLVSPIWNADVGVFATVECVRCQFPIRKRLRPGLTEPVEARCIECGAEYVVTQEGEGKTAWQPDAQQRECMTPGCPEKVLLWPDELKVGTWWKCPGCGERYGLGLSIGKLPKEEAVEEPSEIES